MAEFRKKPVVIEAIRVSDALQTAGGAWELPPWLEAAYERGEVLFLPDAVEITTLEGTMRGERDDWIIRGVQGELYPCKPGMGTVKFPQVAPLSYPDVGCG